MFDFSPKYLFKNVDLVLNLKFIKLYPVTESLKKTDVSAGTDHVGPKVLKKIGLWQTLKFY